MRTTERTRRRRRGPPPPLRVSADHGDHGDHGRPRRPRPVTAITAERFGRGVTAPASRTRRARHGSGCRRSWVRTAPSGHDLSTAVTAVVTAGSRPGAPGAALTRSSARWGERRALAARRGPPRGREPPLGRAGGSNKANASTFLLHFHRRCLVQNSRRFLFPGLARRFHFEFAPSATNRLGLALNCPAGSRPSARTFGLTWC